MLALAPSAGEQADSEHPPAQAAHGRPAYDSTPRAAGPKKRGLGGGKATSCRGGFETRPYLAGPAGAQTTQFVEELGGRVDAVLQRLNDKHEQPVVVMAERFVVALPVDRVNDRG